MILVVGDVMTDVVVRAGAAFAHATDTPATIVARAGGSGANIACWLGALGAEVAFAGRVGRADADEQEAALRAHGVRTHLARDPGRETGRTVAIVEADGERSFYADRGANLNLCDADLPARLLDGARLLHLSGHTLGAPGPRAAALALARGRPPGCLLSVDAGSAAYWRDGADAFADGARGAGLVFANAAEAALLGPPRGEAIRVVTEGAAGARAWQGGDVAHAPAEPADTVDAIGAGDAFVAGFLHAWLDRRDPRRALQAGAWAAARALRGVGGRPEGAKPVEAAGDRV